MKILTFNPREATFKLDLINIGDYIEAEFVANHGVSHFSEGLRGPVPIVAIELLLKISANMPPESVMFKTGGHTSYSLLDGRQPGEKLEMWPVPFTHRQYTWHQLCVNGEVVTINGRSKVTR